MGRYGTTKTTAKNPLATPPLTPNFHFPLPTEHGNTLFVFGTLKNPRTRSLMMGREYDSPTFEATLRGFRKTGYLRIDRGSASDSVPGMLLTGLTLADMINLDRYEGIYGDGSFHAYARENVEIEIDTNGVDRTALLIKAALAPRAVFVGVPGSDEANLIRVPTFAYVTPRAEDYPPEELARVAKLHGYDTTLADPSFSTLDPAEASPFTERAEITHHYTSASLRSKGLRPD